VGRRVTCESRFKLKAGNFGVKPRGLAPGGDRSPAASQSNEVQTEAYSLPHRPRSKIVTEERKPNKFPLKPNPLYCNTVPSSLYC